MAITIVCPRCKQSLSVPRKMSGSYANCPRCQGRFWVADDTEGEGQLAEPQSGAMAGPTPVGSTGPNSGSAAQPVKPDDRASAGPAAPGRAMRPGSGNGFLPDALGTGEAAAQPASAVPASRGEVSTSTSASAGVLRPMPDRPGRKVARFIATEAAQSALRIAEDGRLPGLHLQDGRQKAKAEGKATTISPLVLAGLICFSITLSIVLALYDTGPESASRTERAQQAQTIIEEQFFGEIGSQEPLEPYQVLLREAQQAFSRGDRKSERELYRQVLEMLRAERSDFDKGLTGSRSQDRKLEAQISILLNSR